MYKENRVHTNIILTDLPKSQIINQFSYFLISYFELAIQSFLSLIIFCYWLNTWPPPISPDSLVVILLADLVPCTRVRSGQVFLYCCLLMWFYSKLTMLNKNTEIIDLQFYLYVFQKLPNSSTWIQQPHHNWPPKSSKNIQSFLGTRIWLRIMSISTLNCVIFSHKSVIYVDWYPDLFIFSWIILHNLKN